MYELLLCHRRSRHTGIGALRDHWRHRRGPVVTELKGALRYDSYVQVHRSSRLNILYLGILASRSWPLSALFSVLQGRSVPPLMGRPGRCNELWDVVESFRYASHMALVEAVTSDVGIAALKRLSADALGFVRQCAAVVAEVLPVYDDPSLGWPRTVTVFCLRARPPMTRDSMLERWRTAHRELVLSLRPTLEYRKYDQLHARDAPDLATEAVGVPIGTFDGVAMLAYGSQWDLIKRLLSPATQIGNLRLSKDEVNFIDGRNSTLVFGEAYAFSGGETLAPTA